MFVLIRFEIRKLWAQKRSWMGLGTILLINALFAVAFYLRHRRAADHEQPGLPGRLIGEFLNAHVYTQTILAPCTYLLFPMVLSIVGAYLLAGELELGSLRMILFRPISRWQIVLAKFLALSLYALAMVVLLLGVSYGVATVCTKPRGDLLVLRPMFGLALPQDAAPPPGNQTRIERRHRRHAQALSLIRAEEAPRRLLLTYALAWPMLISVGALALMFALLTRHFTSAAILTTTVYFCSYIVQSIELLSSIHAFLPTRWLPFFKYALEAEIPWQTIAVSAGWTGAYTAVYLVIAVALFNLRDV